MRQVLALQGVMRHVLAIQGVTRYSEVAAGLLGFEEGLKLLFLVVVFPDKVPVHLNIK